MPTLQRFVALGLIVSISSLALADLGIAQEMTGASTRALTRQQVDQFGVGAKVKVRLRDGRKLRGSIQAIQDETFLLASARGVSPQPVSYDQVRQLQLAKLTYRARGQQDPAEARRVAAGLGVGHHIVVKTAAGEEYHGNIQALASDHFVVLPDRATAPVIIAYADVVQLGPNLSTITWVAIGVGVGVAVLVLVMVAVYVWGPSS